MSEAAVIEAPTSAIVPYRGPGRPTIYSQGLSDRVCKAIAAGTTLREVCRQEWAPDHDTLYEWRKRMPEFADALAHARRSCADHLADSCLPIIDDVNTDSEFGSARVSKAREQVGVRRWLAGCLDRDTYGERTQVNVSGTIGALVAFVGSTPRAEDRGRVIDAIPHAVVPDGAGEDPAT